MRGRGVQAARATRGEGLPAHVRDHVASGLWAYDCWDEICVQVQGEQSFFWDVYESEIERVIASRIGELERHELAAIWLQTDEGMDWSFEDPTDRDDDPCMTDAVVAYLANHYVLRSASNWSNPRIRAFLEGNWTLD